MELTGKLQRRTTLSLFGVDVKITPDNEVKIIEINGARSGMHGFGECYDPRQRMEHIVERRSPDWFKLHYIFSGTEKRADIHWLNYLANIKNTMQKPMLIFMPYSNNFLEEMVSKIEKFHKLDLEFVDKKNYLVCTPNNINYNALGLEQIYSTPSGEEETEFLMSFYDAETIIWNKSLPSQLRFDERKNLVINSHTIESIVEDKCQFYYLMKPIVKELMPKTAWLSSLNGVLIDDKGLSLNPDFESISNPCNFGGWDCNAYILKPANGSGGKKVYFIPKENIFYENKFHLKQLRNLYEKGLYDLYLSENHKPTKKDLIHFLIQEFIESKPIYSTKTRDYHDGCMRMIVAMQSENGLINSTALGGYWRLAPLPLKSGDSQRSHIANLSNHAIPEQSSEEEINLVWNKIKHPMRLIYKEMLKVPIKKARGGWSAKIFGK